jgi:hypothetical protein
VRRKQNIDNGFGHRATSKHIFKTIYNEPNDFNSTAFCDQSERLRDKTMLPMCISMGKFGRFERSEGIEFVAGSLAWE